MVFYRKYRPQTIDQLDSTAVRDMLHSVLQKEVPHAFLFTGPKGLGKTSTARILAKAVNCEKRGKNLEPCNTCEQ
ncbi:MAG: AAA family ATPase, partial [Candidatus Levyibacteriota bacterium]